jgi:hypothetical protein
LTKAKNPIIGQAKGLPVLFSLSPYEVCLTGVKRTSFGTDKSPVFCVKIFRNIFICHQNFALNTSLLARSKMQGTLSRCIFRKFWQDCDAVVLTYYKEQAYQNY